MGDSSPLHTRILASVGNGDYATFGLEINLDAAE